MRGRASVFISRCLPGVKDTGVCCDLSTAFDGSDYSATERVSCCARWSVDGHDWHFSSPQTPRMENIPPRCPPLLFVLVHTFPSGEPSFGQNRSKMPCPLLPLSDFHCTLVVASFLGVKLAWHIGTIATRTTSRHHHHNYHHHRTVPALTTWVHKENRQDNPEKTTTIRRQATSRNRHTINHFLPRHIIHELTTACSTSFHIFSYFFTRLLSGTTSSLSRATK
ncbi:unnamed protein product [Ectocarpus sp. 12 AP-2014]